MFTYLDDTDALRVGQQVTWRFVFTEGLHVEPEWRVETKWQATPLDVPCPPGDHPTLLHAGGVAAYWEADRRVEGSVRLTGELVPGDAPAEVPAFTVRIDDLRVFSVEYARRVPSAAEAVSLDDTAEYRRVQSTPAFALDAVDPIYRPDGRHDLGVLVEFTVVD